MEDPSNLVYRSRTGAGLSRKALARRAGVPTSTVSRVEDGNVDPTTTTLRRLLAAADRTLVFEISGIPRGSLAPLADAVDQTRDPAVIDWTRIRAFLDAIAANPARLSDAIATPPPRSGDDRLDNLLAAIAETLADKYELARPRWCGTVDPLSTPWEPPGTPRMRDLARRSAPEQFKARNIWFSERDFWRDRG